MAPSFVPASQASTPSGKDVVVIGQKNGILWIFDAISGNIESATVVGPDLTSSGVLVWGIAVDFSRAYFTVLNPNYATCIVLSDHVNVSNAAYGAVDLQTGGIVWEVPVPQNGTSYAPPSVTNDLVIVGRSGDFDFVPAPGDASNIVFLDKANCALVAEVKTEQTQFGGAAVDGRYILFGSGYSYAPPGSFNVYTAEG